MKQWEPIYDNREWKYELKSAKNLQTSEDKSPNDNDDSKAHLEVTSKFDTLENGCSIFSVVEVSSRTSTRNSKIS